MRRTETLRMEFEYPPEFIIYGLDVREPCDHDHDPGLDHSEVTSTVPDERVLGRLKGLVGRLEARIAAKGESE